MEAVEVVNSVEATPIKATSDEAPSSDENDVGGVPIPSDIDGEISEAHLYYSLQICTEIHWQQQRKVQGGSYWSHPMLTAGLAVKVGGGLRAACIATVHDAVEEGGQDAWAKLRAVLPDSVCDAVRLLTPPASEKSLPWIDRKTHTIERLRQCHDTDVLLVAGCDKWATLTEMNWDIDHYGAITVLQRMKALKKPMLWYYQSVFEALRYRVPLMLEEALATELARFRERQPNPSLI